MINRMSIVATSAIDVMRQDIKLQKKKEIRKVGPVEQKYNGDLLMKNPYANQVFIYDKNGKKVEQEETHFDKRI